MTKKIAVFVGTRPEGIKLAPVIQALESHPDVEPIVILTGQHKELLAPIVQRFKIPVHHELHTMYPSNTLATLSSHLLQQIDALLADMRCDAAIVQGDTTTMLMATFVCFYRHIPIGHVEAGLRTCNLREPFPEEANRRLASHLVTWHFAPTERSRNNLQDEGIPAHKIFVTGNTVVDALYQERARQNDPQIRKALEESHLQMVGNTSKRDFVLVTCHRRENFGEGIEQITHALRRLSEKYTDTDWVVPIHLNPAVRAPLEKALKAQPNIKLIPPQGYPQFVWLLQNCRFVLTDSGGVQEEAPAFQKQTLVMRGQTERPEGVELGWTKLVGSDASAIVEGANALMQKTEIHETLPIGPNPYGDGRASIRIVNAMAELLGSSTTREGRKPDLSKQPSQTKRAPLMPA